MLLYYITDRRQFSGTDAGQRRALLAKITEAARAGIDYIQLREKDLTVRALEQLARESVAIVHGESANTKLLINSRIDVALASGADGIHLTSADIPASEARNIWTGARSAGQPIVAVSCHSADDIRVATSHGADFVTLAPIFEKVQAGAKGIGLNALRASTRPHRSHDNRVEAGDHRTGVPVLALGGVTLSNAGQCLAAGAAGIAAIRLFQQFDTKTAIDRLREER